MKCEHKWATAIHHVTYKWCGYVCENCGKCTENIGHSRFWNRLLNEKFRRVVKIKSLIPYYADGLLWWPVLLVDNEHNKRVTVTAGWSWARFKALTQSKGDK